MAAPDVTTPELPCAMKGCAALATDGTFCAVHRSLNKEPYARTCVICAKSIAAGKWHRQTDAGASCYPSCAAKKPDAA